MALRWRRSGRCDTNACVEVAVTASGGVVLRDSARADGPYLRFGSTSWRGFVRTVSAGGFADGEPGDPPGALGG
ncbi:DUF397 domain-containing protein [Solwaraspora sp. WMMD406]|uniref:DUF397 domain-containing protein n=1 Tax=Solwaraspora sp. WMMD406 TaxID=3016095 RepID=UPI00241801FC|nr:DUF397 domain-containing protein [Solwaraspora sp. WMMD406]MDG4767104.1 DUF397 domain-containing protein [Solwaraspora sp. WMMD406]